MAGSGRFLAVVPVIVSDADFISFTTKYWYYLVQVPVLFVSTRGFSIYQYYLDLVSVQMWFLQLELCNSVSANPHGCVSRSGLHDITAGQSADDSAGLMTNGEPFSARNGRSVNQTVASSRIREIGEECGDLEMNTGFGELVRILECQPEWDLDKIPEMCDSILWNSSHISRGTILT